MNYVTVRYFPCVVKRPAAQSIGKIVDLKSISRGDSLSSAAVLLSNVKVRSKRVQSIQASSRQVEQASRRDDLGSALHDSRWPDAVVSASG